MYHVPPNRKWDASALGERLRSRGMNADVIGDSIRIALPPPASDSSVGKLLRRLLPVRSLYVMVSYYPDRFLENLELQCDVLKLSDTQLNEIYGAVEDCGYVFVEDQREIVSRYCSITGEMAELLDELDHLQAKKELRVTSQDFDGALAAREREVAVRRRIDAMLFSAFARVR